MHLSNMLDIIVKVENASIAKCGFGLDISFLCRNLQTVPKVIFVAKIGEIMHKKNWTLKRVID